ncbi:hypothetical protein PMSD_06125 [Paenibacillus macquariensis subsp. defensor]|nr:hypothetical protein PMSD_06125 [Paenibacillus macquariensis subsp. defensor]
MNNLTRLNVATEEDADQIRDLMIEVEEDETSKWYSNGERPHIPGFDSLDMHKYHARYGRYYKIINRDILVGVILISTTGREHARIDRLYILPGYQGENIGSDVLLLIEESNPEIKIWTLDTTQKSPRNHYFYEKNGYRLVAEDKYERYYRKETNCNDYGQSEFSTNKDFSKQNFRGCNLQDTDYYDVNLNNTCFSNANMGNVRLQNVNLSNTHITNTNMSNSILGDSNMSNVEICHVSLGGAYLHDTNLSVDGEKRPLLLERCEMIGSKMVDSNLSNLTIQNCNIEGMKIDGILVTDLLRSYNNSK